MPDSNAEVAGALLQAWNAHDLPRVASFFAPEYRGEDVGQAHLQHGPGGWTASLARYLEAFPDIHWTGDCIVEGNAVALIWTMQGTHRGMLMHIPPTGKHIEVRGVSVLTLRDGKVIHGQNIWDTGGLLRALGLLPELT